jgi:hypothetical protein
MNEFVFPLLLYPNEVQTASVALDYKLKTYSRIVISRILMPHHLFRYSEDTLHKL